ncbi:MAG: multidrug efflux SMR transporter [Bdellovibrionota bacterium]
MSAWLNLFVAGAFEICFTTMMKLSQGFTKIPYTIGFAICGICSFYFLNRAIVAAIPLGTGYAVWTGIGAFGTAIVGMLFFKDPVTPWRVFFLLTLIASIVGLKLVSPAD